MSPLAGDLLRQQVGRHTLGAAGLRLIVSSVVSCRAAGPKAATPSGIKPGQQYRLQEAVGARPCTGGTHLHPRCRLLLLPGSPQTPFHLALQSLPSLCPHVTSCSFGRGTPQRRSSAGRTVPTCCLGSCRLAAAAVEKTNRPFSPKCLTLNPGSAT